VRPEFFLYVLATALIISGVALSYLIDIPVVGLGFFIMGVLLFLLPSMRKPSRRL
jgi:cytochrome b561